MPNNPLIKLLQKTDAVILRVNFRLHNNSDMMKDSNNIIRIINTHPCGIKAKMPKETFNIKLELISSKDHGDSSLIHNPVHVTSQHTSARRGYRYFVQALFAGGGPGGRNKYSQNPSWEQSSWICLMESTCRSLCL